MLKDDYDKKNGLPHIIIKNEKDWSRMLTEAYDKGCYFRLEPKDDDLINVKEYLCSPEIRNSNNRGD